MIAREVRSALFDAGFSFRLPSGATMFVTPEQYNGALAAVRDWNLQRSHIVVLSELEGLFEELRQSLPSKARVHIKRRDPIPGSQVLAQEQGRPYYVSNTFVALGSERGSQSSHRSAQTL